MKTLTRETKLKSTKPSIKNARSVRFTRRKTNITEDVIRKKAYDIYLENDTNSGNELDDWIRAENELRQSEM
jgi:hypothetical protein